MKIVNENVSCGTCKYQYMQENCKCNKCIRSNGWLGWQPALGVKVKETHGISIIKGKPVETIFRKVIS